MYKAIILPRAKFDIEEAAKWYNKRLPGLGRKFTGDVRETVKYLCHNPKVAAVRCDETRTILLDTFPYLISMKNEAR